MTNRGFVEVCAAENKKSEESPITEVTKIACVKDWDGLDRTVEAIEVCCHCCNDESVKGLDLSGFVNLRELRVGDECFKNAKRMNICNLEKLKWIRIGSYSFTKEKEKSYSENDGQFYLRNCPRMSELRIGYRSFSDYSVCAIEDVDALETIEIGGMTEWSSNFWAAPLELRTIPLCSA